MYLLLVGFLLVLQVIPYTESCLGSYTPTKIVSDTDQLQENIETLDGHRQTIRKYIVDMRIKPLQDATTFREEELWYLRQIPYRCTKFIKGILDNLVKYADNIEKTVNASSKNVIKCTETALESYRTELDNQEQEIRDLKSSDDSAEGINEVKNELKNSQESLKQFVASVSEYAGKYQQLAQSITQSMQSNQGNPKALVNNIKSQGNAIDEVVNTNTDGINDAESSFSSLKDASQKETDKAIAYLRKAQSIQNSEKVNEILRKAVRCISLEGGKIRKQILSSLQAFSSSTGQPDLPTYDPQVEDVETSPDLIESYLLPYYQDTYDILDSLEIYLDRLYPWLKDGNWLAQTVLGSLLAIFLTAFAIGAFLLFRASNHKKQMQRIEEYRDYHQYVSMTSANIDI